MAGAKALKINDSKPEITVGSRADLHLRVNPYKKMFVVLRPGLRSPSGMDANNIDSIIKQFHLKGIAFGNWVTLEDRLNYSNALMMAFYDLNKVLKFNYNLGISNNLSVTFGDRGIPKSLAHYNPHRILININRYKRGSSNKERRFLSTGGIHSFAHEYGHFLDFFAGDSLEPDGSILSLSDGISVSRSKTERKTPMRALMDSILYKLTWNKSGELTKYYANIVELINTDGNGIGEYWIRRTEIFARTFESYIKYELDEMGIKNGFLVKLSYDSWAYPDKALLVSIVPEMRQLIRLIRDKI